MLGHLFFVLSGYVEHRLVIIARVYAVRPCGSQHGIGARANRHAVDKLSTASTSGTGRFEFGFTGSVKSMETSME